MAGLMSQKQCARMQWKAYSRGMRTSRRFKRYNYTLNPYIYQTPEWYSFNQGWNDAKSM